MCDRGRCWRDAYHSIIIDTCDERIEIVANVFRETPRSRASSENAMRALLFMTHWT